MDNMILELLKQALASEPADVQLPNEHGGSDHPFRAGQGAKAIQPVGWHKDPMLGVPVKMAVPAGSFVDQEERRQDRAGLPGHTSELDPRMLGHKNPYTSFEGMQRGDISLDTGYESMVNALKHNEATKGKIGWDHPVFGSIMPKFATPENESGDGNIQLPAKKMSMMGPAAPGSALPGEADAKVTEAGVPTGKGMFAELAAKLGGYDASSVLNPQLIERLAAQAKPVMSKLTSEGAFAGDRTTGSGMLEVLKRLKSMQSPADGLGSQLAEYAPVGGESTINALRPATGKVPNIVEQAYQRLLMNGGR